MRQMLVLVAVAVLGVGAWMALSDSGRQTARAGHTADVREGTATAEPAAKPAAPAAVTKAAEATAVKPIAPATVPSEPAAKLAAATPAASKPAATESAAKPKRIAQADTGVGAQQPRPADKAARLPANKAIVDMKKLLVENMAYKSTAAKSITESGDAEAIAALDSAKKMIDEAKVLGADSKFAEADEKLNAALKLINDHARRLTLHEVGGERAKVIYERRRHAVETFLNAYKRVSSDPNANSASALPKEHQDWIAEKLAEADGLAAKGEHEKAQGPLEAAYERTRDLIRDMRAGQKLVRDLKFETPKEEYEYEVKRNDSHFALLEFAIVEKNPQGSIVTRIHQDRDKAKGVRKGAEAMADKGEYVEAIKELNTSTMMLLQAIRMSGIYVPG